MSSKANQYLYSITIIGVLFFIFGFVTWLNGLLIPFLKIACDLQTDVQALLVATAFYIAYFVLAIPSSAILNKTGYKKGMSLGLIIMAMGALLFIPAAGSRSYTLFLVALFIQAGGLTLLQTASNPYVSILGPIESAAQRISIMGICNKVAGVLSPIILGAIILSDANEIEQKVLDVTDPVLRNELLSELASRVVMPYIVMAIVLVILAVLIYVSSLPEISAPEDDASQGETKKTNILQFPHLLLGVLCIFLYVGAEVMAGDVIGLYGKSLGLTLDQSKSLTSYTLSSMVIGYILGIITIPKYIKQEKALMISAIVSIVFSALAYATSGFVSIMFIALLGLGNALMWPAIFPLAIDGLGRFTKIGSALLIMGVIGGALVPLVYGALSAKMSAQSAFFWCVLPCYLFILYYSVSGYKAGRKTA